MINYIVKWAGGPGWKDSEGNEPPITYAVIDKKGEPIEYNEDFNFLSLKYNIQILSD